MTKLPEWLDRVLPEPQPYAVVSLTEDERYRVLHPDGSEEVFDTVEDFYERLHGYDFTMDKEVYRHNGYDDYDLFTFPSSKHRGMATLVLPHTDEDRRATLERAYRYWLETAEAYASNPSNFVKAYRFVSDHPIHWKPEGKDWPTWHWSTSDLASSQVTVYVVEKNGKVYVNMDTGAHVEDTNYTTRYADYRLEVTASTFELAYVMLAERIATYYNVDGTEVSPEPSHVRPRWLKELEARVGELEENLEEDETPEA